MKEVRSSKTKARLPCGRPIPVVSKTEAAARPTRDVFLKRLNAYLEEKDLNQSDSRNRIVDIILEEDRHFSINDLVTKVHSAYPNIGSATIYRNVPVLLEAGIIRETLVDDQRQKVYEIEAEEHHDHIVCTDCQEIFEFHSEVIETAQNKISEKMSFIPTRHRHVIYASCKFKKSSVSKGR